MELRIINKKPLEGAEKRTKEESMKNKAKIIIIRWFFFICVGLLAFPGSDMKAAGLPLLETFAVAFIYNLTLSFYTLKQKERIDKLSYKILYLDITFLCIISYFDGGLASDAFLFIFFIIGYCGIFSDAGRTFRVGTFAVVFYTAACVFSIGATGTEFRAVQLVIRDIIILLGAYGMSLVNYEVKRYEELRKKEFKLARTDKLTGLANRHYFDQKLKEEIIYVNQNNTVLNVLMFDLDNFKSFNDTYGHLSGDKLLALFSDIVKQCIRKSDIPVRYGGEEFLILIRDLDIMIAKSVGERIRSQLEKQRIYVGCGDSRKKVSVSCGVAQYPTHSDNIKLVVEMADQALYHAKAIGKNVVVTFDDIAHEPA